MPWQQERYPANWQDLTLACKEKAGWKCERCGVANGTQRIGKKRGTVYTVRLAAAHLDHDPENPDPRLIALCEVCHLRYDRFLHSRNARRTKHAKRYQKTLAAGQLELFRGEDEQ